MPNVNKPSHLVGTTIRKPNTSCAVRCGNRYVGIWARLGPLREARLFQTRREAQNTMIWRRGEEVVKVVIVVLD